MRLIKVYRDLWGLSGNPFPDHAIASAGDLAQPFYENLHPGINAKMARAFLGANGAAPKTAFLWSLGYGEEARGYGKTRHLLWFAAGINSDLGLSAAELAGRGSESGRLLAAYAAFSTVDSLSLSNLLFDVALNLVRSQAESLLKLRAAEFKKGKRPDDLYQAASEPVRTSGEYWSYGLLGALCFSEPQDWIDYLERLGKWHRVRYGRQLLRSLVAFLGALGIDRLLILVDQVEDFASSPTYKLRRDFARLAHLCATDQFLSSRVTYVLTMHPRAARVVSAYWAEAALGPMRHDEDAGNVVLLGPITKVRFFALVKAYLDTVRVRPSGDPLRPFKDKALELIHEHERGRPGYCLQRLFLLLDLAAAEGTEYIEREFVERYLEDSGRE